MIERWGELRLTNNSDEGLILQIMEISSDSNILTTLFEGRLAEEQDIPPLGNILIKFCVVPETIGDEEEVNLYFKLRFYD